MRQNLSLQKLFWSIDSAIKPSAWASSIVQEIIKQLRSNSLAMNGNGEFNALHLRIGEDCFVQNLIAVQSYLCQ